MTNEGRILQAFSNCNSEAKLQILQVTTQLLLIMVQIRCKKLKNISNDCCKYVLETDAKKMRHTFLSAISELLKVQPFTDIFQKA